MGCGRQRLHRLSHVRCAHYPGARFDPLDEKIIQIIREKGPSTGLTSEYELLAAEEIIKHMPAVEMVRFLQSGTEADMAAIRIARAFTGKQKIIKIFGELPWLVRSDGVLSSHPRDRVSQLPWHHE